ncbi:NADH-quinone oxidoreductase subunit NuoE [Henriciella sp.]|uniref:NADH-quinone oxidoreductase subunit NuoE n=1 Tax=Henriciella sp. TaxID=1968823 RepID=UPI00261F38D0|nr:NADH-quinone oxidoreductase subunit NuoE [Henriciella sp.]
MLRRFDMEAGGDEFTFKPETEPKITFWREKYPADKQRSAVIPLLWLAQKDNNGWLSEPAMREVADRLEMPYIRVYEVATFYTMFKLAPVGKYHVQLCGTTPCMLRGANDLKEVCQQKIGKKMAVTDDGRLSWEEVECLGACVNAPMVQINDYYYEDLTVESLEEILGKLGNGVDVAPGNFVDRQKSAPEGGPTTLKSGDLYDGSRNTSGVLPNLPEAEAGDKPEPEAKGEPPRKDPTNVEREEPGVEGEPPETLEVKKGEADDLKKIEGVGPTIEKKLNEAGICKFSQIAAWTEENIKWIDQSLVFRGRVWRDEWVKQAKALENGDSSSGGKKGKV